LFAFLAAAYFFSFLISFWYLIFSRRASAFFSSLLFFLYTFGTYGFGTSFFGSKNDGIFGVFPRALAFLYSKIAFL